MASGPSLTFISLPRVFASMGGVGRIVGIVFFLALGFAALTSCVSVMETPVANCMEIFHKSRKEMCAMVGVYSLVTAVTICLGYNVFYFELTLPNGSAAQLLDVMDYISNSFLMPFISLLTSILIGWVIGPKWVIDEVEKNGEHFGRAKLYSVMMRYVVPVVMLIFIDSLKREPKGSRFSYDSVDPVTYRLLDFLQMCIASADLISSSRKSGCAMPIRASERSQVDMPFRFTMPYSVTM